MKLILDSSSCLVVAPREPFSVQRAARSVVNDIAEAGGFSPRLVESRPADASIAIVIESDGQLAGSYGLSEQIRADEAFAIRALEHESKPTILITGNGERGAIYGLYHFSRTQLDTDPLKHITGFRPAFRKPVLLDRVDHTSTPFRFRFRGWHVEPHGLIRPWSGQDNTTRDHWERLLETLLRCGGNMVKPETNRPDSNEVRIAQEMGLLITQEHCCPFGIGMWEIQSTLPGFQFRFDDHPEVFLDAWKRGMQRYPHPEKVIWTLSFRGRGDRPFWEADPRYDTDAKRGELISRVIRTQKDLVERHLGHRAPGFIHNAWMEGNRLVSEGHTRVPEGVFTVWADNGYGSFRSMISEGCAPEQVRDILPTNPPPGLHGVYYHVSMWDFCTPFLTQLVPLHRIEREFGRVIERGITAYLLINVGHVSQCILSVAAIADVWNYPERWAKRNISKPDEFASDFLRQWCEKYFGAAVAPDAIRCYEFLYSTPIKYGEWGGWDDYVFGDVAYVRVARMFVQAALSQHSRREHETMRHRFFRNEPIPVAKRMAWVQRKTAEAAPRWDEAQILAASVAGRLEGTARRFFEADVLAQIEINQSMNFYLHQVTEAVMHYEAGRFEETVEALHAAREHLSTFRTALGHRDYGAWDDAWDNEQLLHVACVPMAAEQIESLLAASENLIGKATNPFPG